MSEEIKTIAKEDEIPTREIVYEEAIEAILFAAGHPITYTNLARVLDLTPGKVKDIVVEYARTYNTTDMPRGVILLAYEDSCQGAEEDAPKAEDSANTPKDNTHTEETSAEDDIIDYE